MQKHKVKINVPENEYNTLKKVVNTFSENNFECYLVGGSVRDLILGNVIQDYDFTTNAHPHEVMKLFSRVIPTGIKHGTVTVLLDKYTIEITTYRADGKYLDGRRPESVSFSNSLKEDIKRRDFTINGLAYDLFKNQVIDYIDGIKDIKEKIIRTIGDPIERFNEDGLRTYRACRIASKLGFDIEDKTFNAILKTLDVAKKISIERIRDELKKILLTKKPSLGLEYLRKSGLLKQVLPELDACYNVGQNKYHIHDIYYHSLYSCDAASADNIIVRLAALLHDIGKVPTKQLGRAGDFTFYNHEVVGAKITRHLMKRLKFSNDEVNSVNNLVINHMFHYTDEWTDGAVRRFMRKVGVDNLEDVFFLRLADRKGNGSREGLPVPIKKLQQRIDYIIEQDNAISIRDLNINGNLIMEKFDIKPGPVIGKILNELLEVVLDNPHKNEQDTLLLLAEEIISRNK